MITFKTTLGEIKIELDFDNAPVRKSHIQLQHNFLLI